jgi:hypothetical protein
LGFWVTYSMACGQQSWKSRMIAVMQAVPWMLVVSIDSSPHPWVCAISLVSCIGWLGMRG